MIDLLIRSARLLDRVPDEPVDISVDGGRIVAISPSTGEAPEARHVVEATGSIVTAPFVEPHVHLDAALTAGQPRWNASGTLWEGIACWAERRPLLTRDDVVERAERTLRWYVANGTLYVRSHVDVTDPELVALDALLEVRDRVRDVLDLQLVAFPQEGIYATEHGVRLLEEAARRGADVVGAIPHYEDTREDGVRSVEYAFEVAERYGLRVDAHCDEIDDDHSRFVEVLATRAARTGLRERATASHTTAMGSYNPAYSNKIRRIVARSGINLVSNPMVNLHLQGRYDAYPRRRGMTQVKEMLEAGVNVAFGHDDVVDPWYPLGTANALQVAFVGAHGAQLMAPAEIGTCFDMVTSRAARVLGVEDYPLTVGRRADLVVLPAAGRYDAIRRQVRASTVVSRGRVVAETPPPTTTLSWPGEAPEPVTFDR